MSNDADRIVALSDKRGYELFCELIAEIESAHAAGREMHCQWTWVMARADRVGEDCLPTWHCGTTGCIAGLAAFKGGARLVIQSDRHAVRSVSNFTVDVRGTDYEPLANFPDSTFPGDYAEYLLGIDESMGDWLFAADAKWEEIVSFRDAWAMDMAIDADYTTNRQNVIGESLARDFVADESEGEF